MHMVGVATPYLGAIAPGVDGWQASDGAGHQLDIPSEPAHKCVRPLPGRD